MPARVSRPTTCPTSVRRLSPVLLQNRCGLARGVMAAFLMGGDGFFVVPSQNDNGAGWECMGAARNMGQGRALVGPGLSPG